MTNQAEKKPSNPVPFPQLPWVTGGLMLLAFLLTLHRSVSPGNAAVAAQVMGWDWHRVYTAPLHFLLTWPIHLLPLTWQLPALNVFAALCGAIALALLTRSIQLMPHDRTREQRHLQHGEFALLSIPLAWLPAATAVVLCGLQLTFWENATAETGETLNLLLFAYVIRCLLEYRIFPRPAWVGKMAFVYGLGLANDWSFVGFFPLFLVALLWVKGLGFFNFQFLVRAALWGLAGLLLYLFLPALEIASAHGELGFLAALKANLHLQKMYVFGLPYTPNFRLCLFVISASSLVPLLLIGIRWPSFHGDINPLGNLLSNLTFRFLFAAFLILGIAVFFDPAFSARTFGALKRITPPLPFLTFYYLTALAVGYLGGYVLLVFGKEPDRKWEQTKGLLRVLNQLVNGATAAGLVAASAALAYRNLPPIRIANGDAVRNFSSLMRENLPDKGAVILSDDPNRSSLPYLLQASYQQQGIRPDHVILDTYSLQFANYHRFLASRYPQAAAEWIPPSALTGPFVNSLQLIGLLQRLSTRHSIYYLHPSFGYYFERFYLRPHGLVYELKPYPPGLDSLEAPALSAEDITGNQAFWNKVLADKSITGLAGWSKKVPNAGLVASFYSRALNFFGVQLQREHALDAAAKKFQEALAVYPENYVAEINQSFNNYLRQNKGPTYQPADSIRKKFEQYKMWDFYFITEGLTSHGPFDEIDFCLRLGEMFGRGGNLRQSAQLFLRVLAVAPQHLDARIALSKSYLDLQLADRALEVIAGIRKEFNSMPLAQELELTRAESLGWLGKGDFTRGEKILVDARTRQPAEENWWRLLAQFYQATSSAASVGGDQETARIRLGRAIATLEGAVKQFPPNPATLLDLATLQMQAQQYDKAIIHLTAALQLQPGYPTALLNRAIASFQLGNLVAAKKDYETIEQSTSEKYFQVYFGLGEIAFRQKDKSSAKKYYKLYLAYAPPGTAEYKQVAARLQAVKDEKK